MSCNVTLHDTESIRSYIDAAIDTGITCNRTIGCAELVQIIIDANPAAASIIGTE
ncbi:hypothetical protein D3C71_2096060 [compost metagenome]